MFSATESKELRFHFIHRDGLAPIGYDNVRKDTGEHVEPDDIARGFEIEKGVRSVRGDGQGRNRQGRDPQQRVRSQGKLGGVAKAKLAQYERKRDPKKTPEPFGGRKRGKEPIFVVQRHDARRLHYDFRLERDGALASWAVPKGVPLEPGQQHLAVHVEDHPLEYASFEGEIPKGEYGAGTVELWDTGTYELIEEKKNGGLTVRLHGKRLDGTYALVPAKLSGDPKNWLIVRKRDDSEKAAPTARRRYAPMLASLAEDVPSGDGWTYEIKWDGYRIVATVAGSEAELRTRKDQDYTQRFENVAKELVKALKTPDCVVDGEVCALDEDGRPSFSAMQQSKAGTPIAYYVFDLFEVEGEPIIDLPLVERRKRLEKLLDKRNRTIRFSESFDDGRALLQAAKEQHLEGIMAKRLESKYLPGRRTREWLKIKPKGGQEFVIAGYTRGQGRRAGTLGSLVLGAYRGGELVYVGNVGTGFSDQEIDRLLKILKPLERDTPSFREVPKMPKVRKGDVHWVEPRLVAEVEFVEWTHDGRLRAPSYKGLREDKDPRDVRIEEALPTEIRRGRRVLKPSNLDKVFWPEEGITKGDLIAYYRDVADAVIPHVRDRPFTMKRFPDGWQGDFFFQKDAPSHMPDWIKTAEIDVSTRETPRRRRTIRAPLVNDDLSLLWMANMACIDLNTWYSRVDNLERPDWVLFDLDPSPDVGFKETVQVALLVKQALDALELESFVKTSGSDGIHVLVPIARRYTYADTRRFSEIVANALARSYRSLVTTEWTKSKRRGVLIDSNQNGEGKTIASVYSVRPREGAPVSTPLRWNEVTEDLDPRAFTMDAVRDRIRKHGDLFEGVLTTKQSLSTALKALSSR
jgi:bifunctional non-homologous end joining protein LigD